MKEKVIWGLLALLVVSNVSLHLDGKGRDRRMSGVSERMRGSMDRGAWTGKQEGRERVRPERIMPEGRKGKKDKAK